MKLDDFIGKIQNLINLASFGYFLQNAVVSRWYSFFMASSNFQPSLKRFRWVPPKNLDYTLYDHTT